MATRWKFWKWVTTVVALATTVLMTLLSDIVPAFPFLALGFPGLIISSFAPALWMGDSDEGEWVIKTPCQKKTAL